MVRFTPPIARLMTLALNTQLPMDGVPPPTALSAGGGVEAPAAVANPFGVPHGPTGYRASARLAVIEEDGAKALDEGITDEEQKQDESAAEAKPTPQEARKPWTGSAILRETGPGFVQRDMYLLGEEAGPAARYFPKREGKLPREKAEAPEEMQKDSEELQFAVRTAKDAPMQSEQDKTSSMAKAKKMQERPEPAKKPSMGTPMKPEQQRILSAAEPAMAPAMPKRSGTKYQLGEAAGAQARYFPKREEMLAQRKRTMPDEFPASGFGTVDRYFPKRQEMLAQKNTRVPEEVSDSESLGPAARYFPQRAETLAKLAQKEKKTPEEVPESVNRGPAAQYFPKRYETLAKMEQKKEEKDMLKDAQDSESFPAKNNPVKSEEAPSMVEAAKAKEIGKPEQALNAEAKKTEESVVDVAALRAAALRRPTKAAKAKEIGKPEQALNAEAKKTEESGVDVAALRAAALRRPTEAERQQGSLNPADVKQTEPKRLPEQTNAADTKKAISEPESESSTISPFEPEAEQLAKGAAESYEESFWSAVGTATKDRAQLEESEPLQTDMDQEPEQDTTASKGAVMEREQKQEATSVPFYAMKLQQEKLDKQAEPLQVTGAGEDVAVAEEETSSEVRSEPEDATLEETEEDEQEEEKEAETAADNRLKPEEALKILQQGNERFIHGTARSASALSKEQVESLEREGRMPMAVVLGSADSKAPVELLFDSTPGELFVLRNAGNMLGNGDVGGLEYGVGVLGVNLIVVLGHSRCKIMEAAVQTALKWNRPLSNPQTEMEKLLLGLQPIVEQARRDVGTDDIKAITWRATYINAFKQIEYLLLSSGSIRDRAMAGELQVHAAFHDSDTGKVFFVGQHPRLETILGRQSAGEESA